jgi:hypothetical protein
MPTQGSAVQEFLTSFKEVFRATGCAVTKVQDGYARHAEGNPNAIGVCDERYSLLSEFDNLHTELSEAGNPGGGRLPSAARKVRSLLGDCSSSWASPSTRMLWRILRKPNPGIGARRARRRIW